MDRDTLEAIRRMLTTRKVLCLTLIIDGEAAASLLPFAVAPGFLGVYVQASSLARHSRGLLAGAKVGLLVHDPDTDDVDPLQIARLSVQATVEPLERDTGECKAAADVISGRFPTANLTLTLADFRLYRLRFDHGRFIAGFAQAYDLTPETFREMADLR